jgi:hypothetical protein
MECHNQPSNYQLSCNYPTTWSWIFTLAHKKRTNFVLRCPVRVTPTPQADYFHIPAAFTDVCCDLTSPGHTCQGQGSLSTSVVTNPSETTWTSSFLINHSNHQRGSSVETSTEARGKQRGLSHYTLYYSKMMKPPNNCTIFLLPISVAVTYISSYSDTNRLLQTTIQRIESVLFPVLRYVSLYQKYF